MKYFSYILSVLLLSSCATTTQYIEYDNDQSSDRSKSTISLIRTSYYASALRAKVYQDEKLIGRLGPKSLLSWEVDPAKGDIRIISKTENADILTISPKAGESYYIRQRMKMGIIIARPELEIIGEEEAKALIEKINKPKIIITEN